MRPDPESPTAGPDLHEWVSFVVDDVTYLFDVTFLASNWSCAWSHGCPGVRTQPAPELREGCCSYGAHFIDDGDRDRVGRQAARLPVELWQHRPDEVADAFTVDPQATGDDQTGSEPAAVTRIVDDACIFLNRPGFEGGAGCALHLGAVANGESPVAWKPDVCWQLPLRFEERRDDNGHLTRVLRQWDRRDWGEGGAEFHWWCTETDLAFSGHVPVYESMRSEIVELVGERAYGHLVDHLDACPASQLVAHPATDAGR